MQLNIVSGHINNVLSKKKNNFKTIIAYLTMLQAILYLSTLNLLSIFSFSLARLKLVYDVIIYLLRLR